MALVFVTERAADEQGRLIKPQIHGLGPFLCSGVDEEPVSRGIIWNFVSLAKQIFFCRPCVAALGPLFWYPSVISAMRYDRRIERFTIAREKLQSRPWPCRNKRNCVFVWT